jgi:precorrin-6B methylase 2
MGPVPIPPVSDRRSSPLANEAFDAALRTARRFAPYDRLLELTESDYRRGGTALALESMHEVFTSALEHTAEDLTRASHLQPFSNALDTRDLLRGHHLLLFALKGVEKELGFGRSELAEYEKIHALVRGLGQLARMAHETLAVESGEALVGPGKLRTIAERYRCRSVERGVYYRDDMDPVVDTALGITHPAPNRERLADHHYFYEPTPVRMVLEMIDRLRPNEKDVLFDLGCGIGRVCLLTALLTDASTVGIDHETKYIEQARERAEALGIGPRCAFEATDVRVADFSRATIFFLFNPFGGSTLEDTIIKIRMEARERPVRIVSVGATLEPLVREARKGWLRHDYGVRAHGGGEEGLHIFASIDSPPSDRRLRFISVPGKSSSRLAPES